MEENLETKSFNVESASKTEKTPDNFEYTPENFLKLLEDNERLRRRAEEAEKNLTTDRVTGCLNLNFFEKYKIENFNADKDHNKIALVYVDVNDLKKINDTPEDMGGGHKAGDQLIINTANFLRDEFREEDIVIHLHGDEFVVVCRDRDGNMDYEKLKNRIDDIRKRSIGRSSKLSLAIGAAVYDETEHNGKVDTDLNDTERRAEQAMYANKAEMKII